MKLVFELTLNGCGKISACRECHDLRLRTISEKGCTWKCDKFGGNIPYIQNRRGRSHKL